MGIRSNLISEKLTYDDLNAINYEQVTIAYLDLLR